MDKERFLKSDVIRLGILMALALVLGIYLIVTTVLISKDGVFYIGLAQSLVRNPPAVVHRHSLGYPFLIWVAHSVAHLFVGGDSIRLWVHASQSVTLLCRVLALVPLYLLARRLIGGARAFWAVLILVVLPYPADYGSDALRDWPYVMFLSLGLWLLYEALQRRAWWMFALVGLVAAAGYFIQPAAIQLVFYGLLGLAVIRAGSRNEAGWGPVGTAVLLLAGFVVPVAPHVYASGTLIPQQWRPSTLKSPPAIVSVGGKSARSGPLEFEVREGKTLEIAVEAFDPQGDDLFFSLAAVPVGSRPVYQFRLAGTGTRFQTISEAEKNALIATYAEEMLHYEGIVCYAYGQGDVRTGLEPVYRLWSPVLGRHFYTIDASERDAIAAESPNDLWTYETIAFYAYAAGRQPPDAVAVRRFRREQAGHFWTLAGPGRQTGPAPDGNAADEGIAWCVHVPGELPAGMSLEGSILRWRPAPGQIGDHQINIIVSDGEMESCQLVKVTVAARVVPGSHQPEAASHAFRRSGPGPWKTRGKAYYSREIRSGIPLNSPTPGTTHDAGRARVEEETNPAFFPPQVSLSPDFPRACPGASSFGPVRGASQYAGLQNLPGAADKLFDGVAEILMVVFFVPWCLGLYHRMRYEAQRLERVLFAAVLTVNAGLVLTRYTWIETAADRRYCLALVALTIFYVPVGLQLIAEWLNGKRPRLLNERHGFHVLAVLGVAVCMPKLLSPLSADKRHYLSAIQWIRENTRPDEVIAAPDSRMAFYAGRQGLISRDNADPQRADYIIRFVDDGAETSMPLGWSQEYSVAAADRRGRTVVIYRTHRRE